MKLKNQTKIIAEPGKQELFITREFDSPRELVFRAFNEPEMIMQWLGPRGQKMEIEKLDSRTHGSWRFFHYDSKGRKWGFNGVIHEVAAPERIIRTVEFGGLPEKGHVALETTTFEALPGERTKLIIQGVYKSIFDRDAAMMSGMECGVLDSHERLDELFEKQLIKTNMENFTLDKDIKAFCITAKSFPDGVLEAHQKLHALVPFTNDRKYFGISCPEKGVIIYKSAAEEKSPGEGDKLKCEPFIIKAGKYICITLTDFRKDIPNIRDTFQQLLSQPNIDPQGYCLEWYLGQNDVRCMVRLKS